MKNKELELKRINKYLGGLNEINRLVIDGQYNSFLIRDVLAKHKLSLTLFTFATRLGLFTQIERGVYKSNYKIIEPYQIRQIFKLVSDYNVIYKNNSDLKKTMINPKINCHNTINTINSLNENDCIVYLKKLGYKIMKPIQQFEEI